MDAGYPCCDGTVLSGHTRACLKKRDTYGVDSPVHALHTSRTERRAIERAREKLLKKENAALRLRNAKQQARNEVLRRQVEELRRKAIRQPELTIEEVRRIQDAKWGAPPIEVVLAMRQQ